MNEKKSKFLLDTFLDKMEELAVEYEDEVGEPLEIHDFVDLIEATEEKMKRRAVANHLTEDGETLKDYLDTRK